MKPSRDQNMAQGKTIQTGMRDFSESLPMLLLNAHQAVMAHFRPVLRAHGITEQQWRVLRAMQAADTALSMADLSSRTLIMPPSMTRIVRSLEQAGLVARQANPLDQRTSGLTITAAGTRLIQRVAPHSEKQYERIADAIGRPQLGQLTRQLREIVDSLPPGEPPRGAE